MTVAATSPSALWYLTRATGLVTLVLLTASVCLGIAQMRRWAFPGSPRFVVVMLHRGVSLLVVVLLAVHVLGAVLDSYAPIRLMDAVLPFASRYRPLWLGLGALALDLLVAITVTSMLRRRLGLGAWRTIHWLAYACWPVALVHGWGTGTDTQATWMLAVTLGCVAAVTAALISRLARGAPASRARRSLAGGVGVVLACAIAVWLAQGPLAAGWARRAGTPAALLAVRPRPAPVARGGTPAPLPLLTRFSGELRGSLRRGVSAGGLAVVDLRMRLTGGVSGDLRVRIAGHPSGGGVILDRSAVTLGPPSAPGQLQGRITFLDGTTLTALVGTADGRAERLRIDLALGEHSVRGTISGRPAGGEG